jgi:GT2 family glycosyltransferase
MIEASILIVSKDRKVELEKTISILENYIDRAKHELLVFLDGCVDNSIELKKTYPWIIWEVSKKNVGASRARNILYKKATGVILIGLDDDAHPISENFILTAQNIFNTRKKTGIIAFEEIKGIYCSNNEIMNDKGTEVEEYLTNNFIGCGFAIRKEVYDKTNGFPIWMDIYGEELCLALEVLAKGYEVLYSNQIKINHRVDKNARKQAGRNYFRFEKQLINSTGYYLVYYRNPLFKVLKLFLHNFKKYALTDLKCFIIFLKSVGIVIWKLPGFLKYRTPIDSNIINLRNNLKPIKY